MITKGYHIILTPDFLKKDNKKQKLKGSLQKNTDKKRRVKQQKMEYLTTVLQSGLQQLKISQTEVRAERKLVKQQQLLDQPRDQPRGN